jgi:hypothetical protein
MLGEPTLDATLETELDQPAVATARHLAERLRARVLDDDPQVFAVVLPRDRLEHACVSEVTRRRSGHRFEQLLSLSERACETLVESWKSSSDRPLRDAARDLDQDMLVLGVFNPMTMRDIDPAELLSVARLRRSERRRGIVASELARRVADEVPPALHQFLMTRAFVDQAAQAAAEAPPAEEALRTVMQGRLTQALHDVVTDVMRRHGVWLPELEERLLGKTRSLTDRLLRLAAQN